MLFWLEKRGEREGVREIEKRKREKIEMIGDNWEEGFGFTVHMVAIGMVGVMELKNILLIFTFLSRGI